MKKNPDSLKALSAVVRKFADERDWDQFHSPKNLSMALIVEAGELVEHFQWLTQSQSRQPDAEQQQAIALEMADVLIYLVRLADRSRERGYIFPLYLYPKSKTQQTINSKSAERQPNLNKEIVNQIATTLNLTFTNEKETTENTFAPIDLLDYIYAVLHSPSYREKYKEFLKIDFPRVPYPKDRSRCKIF